MNGLELQQFVRLLFRSVENEFEPGNLLGPVHPFGGGTGGQTVDLFIGEMITPVA